jgi:DNA ligase D-like protein (predicted 3'-phosphoesterase)
MAASEKLSSYRRKRDFAKTAEPTGEALIVTASRRRFVIQKHAATRLHYDLRLELDGVFKSWAVARGPSLDPADKRQSWFRSSEQDSAKAKWTAAGVGTLQFRARGVTEGGRSPTRDTSCARRKSHAAAARGDGVK